MYLIQNGTDYDPILNPGLFSSGAVLKYTPSSKAKNDYLSVLFLMTVFSQSFFAFMCRNFMTFALFSTWHI